ncbi:MAG: type IV secretory system conjugative DNA transfer family protein [Bacteroidia bacterium]
MIIEKLLELIVQLLEAGFSLLTEIIETAVDGVGKRKHTYTANFIPERDLLTRYHTGFCLTGTRSLSAKHSYTNALIVGGTGVGKSSVVLLPSLYKMHGSFVVHDPSGELFQKSAGYLAEKGYEVKVLNFAKPEISARYNPLARTKSSSDIQKVASMLVQNSLGGSGNSDPFWNTQASALLAMLITILKLQPEEYQNLFNVRQLLSHMGGSPKAMDKFFGQYAKTHPLLWTEYKAFIAFDERVVAGVLSTCKAALQLFADGAVARVTANDTLPMEDFRTKPVALFIQNSIADQRYYSVLTSLFFEQFFAYVLSRFPEKNEQDIFFLVDEAASLKFPTLQLAVANVRKHRAGIMLLVQDFNQLVANYGKEDADAIRTNCFAKMYFTGQSHETSKELSEIMGKFDFKNEKGKTIQRPLMTSDEIRTMDIARAIVLCGHNAPIKARLRPYYKKSTYRAYSEMASPEIGNEDSGPVPIMPIELPSHEQEKA